MKALASKVIAKGQAEGSRAPLLSMLLLPRTARAFTREVEEWLVSHDLVLTLESLTTHLLRTLPRDLLDETDKWVDAQKLSLQSNASAVAMSDILVVETVEDSPTTTVSNALWNGHAVTAVSIKKGPCGLAGAANRVHQHRVACVTANAPVLPSVIDENVLGTYGYSNTDSAVTVLHPPSDHLAFGRFLADRVTRGVHLDVLTVLTVGLDLLKGLAHLHLLGFLHRNVNVEAIAMSAAAAEQLRGGGALGKVMVGSLDFVLRTSRGRISSATWAPRNAAPEVLHSRTFEAATDVYGFGVLMLELCNYGRPLSTQVETSRRPEHVPPAIWGIVAPCLAQTCSSRPACSELVVTVEKLLLSNPVGLIPLPGEREAHVTAELLSGLAAAGANPGATVLPSVAIQHVDAGNWPLVRVGLERNPNLHELALTDCVFPVVPPSDIGGVLGSNQLQSLRLDNVRSGSGQALRASDFPVGDQTKSLSLSLHELPPELVSDFVRRCPSVDDLSLSDSTSGLAIMQKLTELMLEPSTLLKHLKRLRVGFANMSYHGVSSLCTWLQANTTVDELDLSKASMDYYAVAAVGQLLRQNHHLKHITLSDKTTSEAGRRLISNALRHNTNMVVVTYT